jgi:hypothetical protein
MPADEEALAMAAREYPTAPCGSIEKTSVDKRSAGLSCAEPQLTYQGLTRIIPLEGTPMLPNLLRIGIILG